jgi:outer membrane protein TolC
MNTPNKLLSKILTPFFRLRRPGGICFIFFLMLVFFASAIPGKGEEITLDQALDFFYKNNYDILISRYEIDKTYAEYVGAKLRPNPILSANAQGVGHYKIYPQRTDETMITLRIDQLIETAGKREIRTNSALAAHEAIKLSYRDVIRNLLIGLPIFNRAQGEILKRNAEFKQIEEQILKVKRLVVTDVRQALIVYQSSLQIFNNYRGRKAAIEDLLNKSETAFSLGGITVLDLLDTRRTYRDFFTKYNQTYVQALLNDELLKVFTGEIR